MTGRKPQSSRRRGGWGGSDLEQPPITLAEALRPFWRRFSLAGFYFVIVFLLGSLGYTIIEGWRWIDSLYMAVTTVTSVGFMELYPLSPAGRTFTMVLIFLGITGLGIWWALTTALIVELDLGGVLRRRRRMRSIEALSDHHIVCGVGRMGRVVVAEMLDAKHPFVVIEQDPARIALVRDAQPDLLFIEGDATLERNLEAAQIQKARGLAACLADDAENILVCMTARHLNPELTMVARAYSEESLEKLRRAGAARVVSPNVTGGVRMAFSLLRPHVVDFLECAISGAGIELRLEQAAIPGGSHFVGQSLAELRIPQRTGLIVLSLQRARGKGPPIYNPGPETRLEAGDVMIVMGSSEQIQQLREYAGKEMELGEEGTEADHTGD
ncbi:MAG: potassium channel protein [Gemmatimonadetes bacterium]|nr:potassium channel protein [Gemmatimonadota bacterium]NIO32315.1 potassium channel protein [Gemmatimonadota bacterium]